MKHHDCQYDTPLVSIFTKLPSSVVCAEEDCYWQRFARDNSPGALDGIRSLAIHHAKSRKHEVVVHLAQELVLRPVEGEPVPAGSDPVPRV